VHPELAPDRTGNTLMIGRSDPETAAGGFDDGPFFHVMNFPPKIKKKVL
jgi:hypothetical protein